VKKLISKRCRMYFYAALAALLGIVVGLGGPGHTEARFFPMKVNHSFEQYETPDGSKVCIRMDIEKYQAGTGVIQVVDIADERGTPVTHSPAYREGL
jgi:hypothetical protein